MKLRYSSVLPLSNPISALRRTMGGCNLWAVFAATALLAACAQTSVLQTSEFPERDLKDARVVLMPVDVELFEVTAGGMLEPKAAWTEKARANVAEALEAKLNGSGVALSGYKAPADDSAEKPVHEQLIKLHETVGQTILTHKFNTQLQLPTKTDVFDYSLGPGAKILNDASGADYGMFVYLRDSYTSAGRVAVMFLAAAIGVGLPGGAQVGFASLVDLHTGEIVWFNRLVSGSGDLRTAAPARSVIDNLLEGVPL